MSTLLRNSLGGGNVFQKNHFYSLCIKKTYFEAEKIASLPVLAM